ncbi:reverse transcriptase domain-containing protein [Tanacetum coccineum]
MKIFYHNLNEITQKSLNSTAGGIFMYKTPNQAYQLLEDKVLLKLDWAKNQKPKSSFKKTVTFADEGSNNSDTDKIMARMDTMIMKMNARYKEMQSRLNHSIPEYDEDDKHMSPEAVAKFMQTFRGTRFYNDYRDRDSNCDNWRSSKRNDYNKDNYRSNFEDKPELQRQFANKQSGRPSRSLPSSTQPNPKGMPNYGKFLKELIRNKHKLEQILSAFRRYERSAMIQNKVPSKLDSLGSFLIPCTFSKVFLCNALADLGASINLMPYSLYAKLSLKTLKPTKMSIRLADGSFQHPIRIAENMLVEVGKFTFLVDFVILEMEEDSKVPLILGDLFSTLPMHIDVINEILEEDFDALLDEGSEILHSIEGTTIEEKLC